MYEWEGEPDLTSISEDELRVRLRELAVEEREISYRRRVIQGRIDLIRSELVRRGGVALSPEELVRVLLGDERQARGHHETRYEDQEGPNSGPSRREEGS
ncbi:MAG: hypothetical protein AVDCRST_MAG28-2545 [uncultured Rubrobacteraceae bacterium]|uniref:RsiG-like domain-containing protein n=1 Tax=uncultured Rubrobacteraceae bacterium TaxID=349277 RepID=A0A6J4R3G9_9ACTN|nr:MAG: hypothetical protein AVDCRST_MAG28-2545 [uncultured Rubrobacteraceae bacterium]